MKRIFTIMITLALCFSVGACGRTNNGRSEEQTESLANEMQEDSKANGAEGQIFDLEAGTVMLNSGYEMPILGIGTFRLSQSEAEDSVYWALRDGYRLIDTARIYGNEAGVGRGIQRAIEEGFVTREEIFVTTKMWTDDYDMALRPLRPPLKDWG